MRPRSSYRASERVSSFLFCTALALGATPWTQRQGGAGRHGLWDKSVSSQLDASAGAAATAPLTYPVPAYYYRMNTGLFRTLKVSAPVVTSSGNVVFVTLDCQLVVLGSPSTWTSDSAATVDSSMTTGNALIENTCYDVVLDDSDNAYVMRHNASFASFVHGFSNINTRVAPFTQTLSNAGADAQGGLATGGEPRIAELYSLGVSYVAGKLYVPLGGLVSALGIAVVDVQSGAVVASSAGGTFNLQGTAGGAAMIDAVSGNAVAFYSLNGEFAAPAPFMSAWNGDGSMKWTASAMLATASASQPPPFVDEPDGRIYAVEEPIPGSTTIRIFCASVVDGSPCTTAWTNNGVLIQDVFVVPGPGGGSYNASWVYSAAGLYTGLGSLERLFYSVSLSADSTAEPFPTEPVGCVVSIDPATGNEIEFYCIPRNETSFYANVNYLATAPLIAKNTRGFGKHTLYVALADATVVAFDPMALAQGPIFSVLPTSTRTSPGSSGLNLPTGISATVACDFLSMNADGTLMFTYWESYEEGGTGMGIVAIPNINAFNPPTPPSPPPSSNAAADAPAGLSPGGAAGVSIVVIAIAGGFALLVRRTGSVSGALSEIGDTVSDLASKVTGKGPARYSYVNNPSSSLLAASAGSSGYSGGGSGYSSTSGAGSGASSAFAGGFKAAGASQL